MKAYDQVDRDLDTLIRGLSDEGFARLKAFLAGYPMDMPLEELNSLISSGCINHTEDKEEV